MEPSIIDIELLKQSNLNMEKELQDLKAETKTGFICLSDKIDKFIEKVEDKYVTKIEYNKLEITIKWMVGALWTVCGGAAIFLITEVLNLIK